MFQSQRLGCSFIISIYKWYKYHPPMIQTDDPMKLIVTYSHWRNKIMNEQKIADISTLTTSLYCLHSWLHYNPGWKRRFYKQSHSVPVSGCLVSVRVNQVRIKTIHRIISVSWHHPRHCFLRQILSVLSGKKLSISSTISTKGLTSFRTTTGTSQTSTLLSIWTEPAQSPVTTGEPR